MAIYHLSVKVISREYGRSVVAAAAYRAGESLREEKTCMTHDYTRKQGVEHSEILIPEGAPAWMRDRRMLWNAVEASEKRKDAQLAREVELGLPLELDSASQVALLRAFVERAFVSKGMVADFSIHRDNPNNPHAHILLTMRRITKNGFGLKERSWNERSQLLAWRRSWEEVTNEHLAEAGLAVRIDHRSLKAQGSSLTPGRKIGVGLERQQSLGLPHHVAERVAEQREIARENGRQILADPASALRSLTHGQATFSSQDLARFLHTRTDGAEQFQAALLKMSTSPEIVTLGRDERGQERYTSREMLEVESRLLDRADRLTERFGHGVEKSRSGSVLSQQGLSAEQRQAFDHLIASGDLKALVGVAGSGKSRVLAAAREAWEAEGYTVRGAALSGIAAENLSVASGIESRTLASFEYTWGRGKDRLGSRDVLVIDESGMVGTRQLARILEAAEKARAKVVVVGDPEQLQAIEAGAPFRAILAESGMAELHEVRRQRVAWQRQATKQLARGNTAEALIGYEHQGSLVQVGSRAAARTALLARWAKEGQSTPRASRLMLAYTRDDVRQLNVAARTLRQQRKELGHSERIQTERGAREFSVRDRIHFLRNERSLGVRNGTLGTIEAIRNGILQVKLDGHDQRIAIDSRFYKDLDYGYAATVHKAQGSTVDRTYVLATAHFDRHSTYVALSRHRESATVVYAAEDFGAVPGEGAARARESLLDTLSRARPKDLVHDYLEAHGASVSAATPARTGPDPRSDLDDLEARQQVAAERWRDRQQAREQSLELERGHAANPGHDPNEGSEKPHRRKRDHSLGGAEDDFGV